MSNWANVAILGKAKNLKGGLLAYAREGLPFLLEEGLEVTFVPPVLHAPRTGRIESAVYQGDGAYLVHFDTINSIDMAEKLQDHSCLVLKSNLPANWQDAQSNLVGFSILNPNQILLGTIVSIEENPAHPLLVVETAQDCREVRIPLVQDFVCSFDKSKQIIVMDLPAGLLDL
jgi:16S rRNA processing protein RimM